MDKLNINPVFVKLNFKPFIFFKYALKVTLNGKLLYYVAQHEIPAFVNHMTSHLSTEELLELKQRAKERRKK